LGCIIGIAGKNKNLQQENKYPLHNVLIRQQK